MLQVKNLTKIYRPKRGVPVTALNSVDLTLPETGMVFLLGKSGSGKSTLLNILGGLDRYNQGDILVMGKSTRHWRQSHFDSYRNTYVGFIFQEYNILNEFSVGANIALALQLQGQKPSSQKVNEILREVDLEGYGTRNPNELSGGQKQRVAIARALVKNPKIIMADEPTGALDSVTGRQVLNTLKKLSRDKLVIVVSHDREFAEQYADRIVELADGRVIRDVERLQADELVANAVPVYMEDSVSLPEEYVLTQADRNAICDYIQNMVNQGKQPKFSLFSKRSSAFQPTDESRIPPCREGYKLIRSRLPLKYAFKLGASGLKHKKFRLVMTILLSCIALGLFGLSDTITAYNYVKTAYGSLTDPDNQFTYAAFRKEMTHEDGWMGGSNRMTQEDLELIRRKTGLDVYPVYTASSYSLHSNIVGEGFYGNSYYMTGFSGCIQVSQQLLDHMDAKLIAGTLPAADDQAVVSEDVLETFREYGYRDYGSEQAREIRSAEDLLGLKIGSDTGYFTICGVVDTGIDLDRFEDLKETVLSEDMDFTEIVTMIALQFELDYARNYSLSGMLMVNEGFIKNSVSLGFLENLSWYASLESSNAYFGLSGLRPMQDSDARKIVWLDGKHRDQLADNEIVLSYDAYTEGIKNYYGYLPEEYDFYRLQDTTGNYASLLELDLKLSCPETDYGYYEYDLSALAGTHELKLVGILPEGYSILLPDRFVDLAGDAAIQQTLSPMPSDNQQILDLVEFSDQEFTDGEWVTTYNMMNPVTFELKTLDVGFEVLSTVFFWIGMVFVVFSSLLFSNFIGISISYKKEQIGILRAIGSRGADVFRIFFAESFIIAMINFVLSFSGTVLVCWGINTLIKRYTGLLLTVLNVGIRQAVLLFAVCLLCAFVATYLPTRKIAAKRPIDAIRDR